MTPEQKLKRIKDGFIAESKGDVIGLWEFINVLHGQFLNSTPAFRRRLAMQLVREMLEESLLLAGEPTKDGRGFIPWPGTITEIIQRIEREWNKLDREPTISDIVWFSAKK